jgi:hypothetical protein
VTLPRVYSHGVRIHNSGRRRTVEEIIGRLPALTAAQISRLEDELRLERHRRASSAGGGEDASRIQERATPPVTEVLEYRPHEDGYLQLELRRYVRRDGSTRERGPYWYFQFHEGGKRRKLYLGKTSDPESALAAKWARARPAGSRLLPGEAPHIGYEVPACGVLHLGRMMKGMPQQRSCDSARRT